MPHQTRDLDGSNHRRGSICETQRVVKTGARAQILRNLMIGIGFKEATSRPQPPRLAALLPDARAEIGLLYRQLGGLIESPLLRPGAWDLAFEDGLIVELDEELHFNRYRNWTLESPRVKDMPWSRDYLRFTAEFETGCLAAGKWGKRWTNPSCEALFGTADLPGNFGISGAPRWKQRALYDAMKDVSAHSTGTKLARLSVHDEVNGVRLGDALELRATIDAEAFGGLLRRRTHVGSHLPVHHVI